MHRLQQGEPLSSRSSSMLSARIFRARARACEIASPPPRWNCPIGCRPGRSVTTASSASFWLTLECPGTRLHWSAWKLGEIPKNWPPRLWAEIEHMGTANGGDHRRLRSLVSGAPTARRTAALRQQIADITARLPDEIQAHP
jgi:hypothetical protein